MACGGSSSSSSNNSGGGSSTGGKPGGTLKVLTGTAPDSLDPQFGYTTQDVEATNMVYTPLLDYAFKEGTAGTVLQPGLAEALPTVSADGLTYKLKLRSGLKFSDGTPVVASDFKYAIKRAIKISWGGKSFFTINIKGAADYDAGKATDISGITTNDATGDITIQLNAAYGAFGNILAFSAAAPIPSTTPMKVQSAKPPVGVGPYKYGAVTPNANYTLVKNPNFAALKLPGIPTGFVDTVQVSVNSNNVTEADQVVNNQADVFDPADTVPAASLAQVSKLTSRYKQEPQAFVLYFFFNTRVAPFNNASARTAVNMAIDRTALARLASGSITPGCYFLPPTIIGHADGPCPYGDPSVVPSAATVAKAKKMIADAGLAGTSVTVWSQTKSPRQQYMAYLTDLLNSLGFKANLKVIQDAVYFQTVGNQSLNPQVGFADWSQDFPNPSDFYLLMSKAGIQSTNNQNIGNVDDPKIESQLATLNAVPASKLQSKEADWKSLDNYLAQQSLAAPFGYQTSPKFLSDKVNYDTAVFNSVNLLEFSTVEFK